MTVLSVMPQTSSRTKKKLEIKTRRGVTDIFLPRTLLNFITAGEEER